MNHGPVCQINILFFSTGDDGPRDRLLLHHGKVCMLVHTKELNINGGKGSDIVCK